MAENSAYTNSNSIHPETGDAASKDAASSSMISRPCTTGHSAPIHLRPHHLLCLQTFVGHGYSPEFVEHMTLIKDQLKADPQTPIALINGADDLCSRCPNCIDAKCTSYKPALFDRLVADKLAAQCLSNVCNTPTHTIVNGIPSCLRITEEILAECCPDCEWKELCIKVCRSLNS